MGKLQRISGAQAIKALERMGFFQARQRGSHVVMKKILPNGAIGCVIPMHRELALGTLRSALKQAGVTPEEFAENL